MYICDEEVREGWWVGGGNFSNRVEVAENELLKLIFAIVFID